MIYVENKRKKESNLLKKYPNAQIIDVTSKATDDLKKLSPFYPHGSIPIPYSSGRTAVCVEGIWQGLKVFETADINEATFTNHTMKDIKRTVRKFGKPLGHRKGINGKELLNYLDARIHIYLPSYLWVLENKVLSIIKKMKKASKTSDFVLLDYNTNCDVLDSKKPLSHAFLVKAFIENNYPTETDLYKELNKRNVKQSSISIKKSTAKPKSKKSTNEMNNNSQLGLF